MSPAHGGGWWSVDARMPHAMRTKTHPPLAALFLAPEAVHLQPASGSSMASLLPFPLETYRSTDPIENLALRVTLRKRGTQGERRLGTSEEASTAPSSATPRAARRRDRGDNTPRSGDEGSDDEVGDEASASQPLRNEKEEEEKLVCPPRVFRWQEKRFGPMEVRAIRKLEDETRKNSRGSGLFRSASSAVGLGSKSDEPPYVLSNHHREVFRKLDAEAIEKGEDYVGDTIYTRVHSESFSDPRDTSTKLTDSSYEVTTPLAKSVLSGAFLKQHRDMLGEAAHVAMHVFAALPEADFEDADERADSTGSASRRKSKADDSEKLSEVLLCVLRRYPGGRLDMKPPLSIGASTGGLVDAAHENEQTARWYAIPGTRYEYLLENLAEGADVHEAIADRVQKLSISAHNAIGVGEKRSVVPELDFATPPRKHARLHYMINLETARGFGPNPVYIAYYALAAPGWTLKQSCVASAVTQTSLVRGAEELAVFDFPIELVVESDGPPQTARPPLSIFFSVVSRDAHERMSLLGYAMACPPSVAGSTVEDIGAWRLAETRVDALRRFFVGGTEELKDLRALGLPPNFDPSKPSCLNRHGLQTVTTGRVRLRVNTIVQQHQPPQAPKAAQARGPQTADGAARRAQFGRPPVSLGTLKGVANISMLGRSDTAADRVKKRLEERRRAEGA